MSHDKIDDAMAINYESDLAHWKKRAIDAESALAAQQQEPTERVADCVLIWSGEHGMYWGADGSGYTPCECKAGRYTRKDAEYRTKHCGPEKRIEIRPYTAPLSGVREGMLRAAEICKGILVECIKNQKERGDHAVIAMCREAITRAADQVNAEEKS